MCRQSFAESVWAMCTYTALKWRRIPLCGYDCSDKFPRVKGAEQLAISQQSEELSDLWLYFNPWRYECIYWPGRMNCPKKGRIESNRRLNARCSGTNATASGKQFQSLTTLHAKQYLLRVRPVCLKVLVMSFLVLAFGRTLTVELLPDQFGWSI